MQEINLSTHEDLSWTLTLSSNSAVLSYSGHSETPPEVKQSVQTFASTSLADNSVIHDEGHVQRQHSTNHLPEENHLLSDSSASSNKSPADNLSSAKEKKKKQRRKEREQKKMSRNRSLRDNRRRPYRNAPSRMFVKLLAKLSLERIGVISESSEPVGNGPCRYYDVVGRFGNIYRVTISRKPSCNCPLGKTKVECKHLIYSPVNRFITKILVKVLRVPAPIRHQRVFLRSELEHIFDVAAGITETGRHRELIEGHCLICMDELQPSDDLVWCEATCGKNVHHQCMNTWINEKHSEDCTATCTYCRSFWIFPWREERLCEIVDLRRDGFMTRSGYLNVAQELGMFDLNPPGKWSRQWINQFEDRQSLLSELDQVAIERHEIEEEQCVGS
ncbi:hypothetical protein ACMFMF_008659 [Clarireedia jacksonii]